MPYEHILRYIYMLATSQKNAMKMPPSRSAACTALIPTAEERFLDAISRLAFFYFYNRGRAAFGELFTFP